MDVQVAGLFHQVEIAEGSGPSVTSRSRLLVPEPARSPALRSASPPDPSRARSHARRSSYRRRLASCMRTQYDFRSPRPSPSRTDGAGQTEAVGATISIIEAWYVDADLYHGRGDEESLLHSA